VRFLPSALLVGCTHNPNHCIWASLPPTPNTVPSFGQKALSMLLITLPVIKSDQVFFPNEMNRLEFQPTKLGKTF